MRRLTISQARRLALAAQGFTDPAPSGKVTVRHFRRVMDRMSLVQLDSVNVCVRSHYMPFFARLGPYDQAALDRWLWRSRENFEYVAHEAAVTPIANYPRWRWRMQLGRWQAGQRLEAEQPGYLGAVHAEVGEHGPLSIRELSDPGNRTGPWWGRSKGKVALEWLYVTGRLAVHERTGTFVVYYDLPERVVPPEVLGREPQEETDAMRELLLAAARSHGVGTATDLADYHRLPIRTARVLIADLARTGVLEEVDVRGWDEPAFVMPDTTLPRRVPSAALLSPFDPLVWHRPRAERLFEFRYRIEIYVPEPDRVYGYYVLPFLMGDRLVARVDLKADRAAGVLRVPGAFVEPDADTPVVAAALAAELRSLANWQGLDDVVVGTRGDLAADLRPHVD